MGPTATARLAPPYESTDPTERLIELGDRLQVPLAACDRLTNAIESGLDACRGQDGPLGGLSRRHRVLVLDVMLQSARSVNSNLIEAAIHRMDFHDAVAESAKAKELRIQLDPRGRPMATQVGSPMEEMVDAPVDMNLAGLLRAVGAALDCLGIAAIGVLGLDAPILKGSFKDVAKDKLPGARAAGGRDERRLRLQLAAVQHLRRSVESSGPDGWKGWALQMRHTYIHRPRRMHIIQTTPFPLRLLGPNGQPLLRTQYDLLLPRDPSRGDMDELGGKRRLESLVLEEVAGTTVDGLLASIGTAAGLAADCLRRIWELRLRRPSLILQPAAQWAPTSSASRVSFRGYRPGSFKFKADQVMLGTSQMPRFLGSGVLDHEASLWNEE